MTVYTKEGGMTASRDCCLIRALNIARQSVARIGIYAYLGVYFL